MTSNSKSIYEFKELQPESEPKLNDFVVVALKKKNSSDYYVGKIFIPKNNKNNFEIRVSPKRYKKMLFAHPNQLDFALVRNKVHTNQFTRTVVGQMQRHSLHLQM